ncbi:MAG: bifunctional 4-hydroxy-2-oxoglutarate aldolase/2-dehydro-3-deoxy-phosphogluconate aldolase [Candidatus Sericytochromatia bacterium]|nr:bifunctional 4-hydroxy-2-oxoglutarate aldolase/2-dehydro-3-deoxy-phosphogluconate aldolase [Candidatus Sericytochromatia bacterium]
MPSEMLAQLARARVVPVVRAPDAGRAVAACRTLKAGGLALVEVALTTPNGVDAIRQLARDGFQVGAGTVMDAAQARAAIAAGASFVVSPCLVPEVLAVAREAGVLAIPGALTPTEVQAAASLGVELIKVFPVASVGGPAYLRLLLDPFPSLRFFPSGGVGLAEAAAYWASGAVALGVASAVAPQAAIAANDQDHILALARQWSALVQNHHGPTH